MGRNGSFKRRFRYSVISFQFSIFFVFFALACGKAAEPDAFGNFEAEEVTVSSQAGGQLRVFTPVEGRNISAGEVVGLVDTVPARLELNQVIAQRAAVGARVNEAGSQIGVFEAQRAVAERNYNRMRRLFAQHAATAQQLDQAERDYRVVIAQIEAARAARSSVSEEAVSGDARVAQIRERIAKSSVVNPVTGTVLATYAKTGEVVQSGQPLYRIANVDTLTLRAYVAGNQLASLRLGQTVRVHADGGSGKMLSMPGTVVWIASKAEFTPTPVQTRDERADLVYQVKVRVANPRGELKIGMPGDLTVASKGDRPE